MWDAGEAALRSALEGRDYELKEGDGAFYGPKIDFHVTDVMGRSWQLGTCQLDFYMPEQFDLSYTSPEDADERPVILHRAISGSIERFLGILIEHTGGDFPAWLAPVQVRVLPISDRHADAAEAARGELAARRSPRGGRCAGRVGRQAHPRRRAREDPVPPRDRRSGSGTAGWCRCAPATARMPGR